ncbi:hypothetical protein DITRI_Ditri01bG0015900 [Diplodiscus trichospermus]
MAILSKKIEEVDMRQLKINQRFSSEPFPSAAGTGAMKVRDEQGSYWKFQYKVNPRGERVLSGGHWVQFLQNNGVQVGDTVAIDKNDLWCTAADYKIEVIRRS